MKQYLLKPTLATGLLVVSAAFLFPLNSYAEYDNAIAYGVYSASNSTCMTGDNLDSAEDYMKIFSCVAKANSYSDCSAIRLSTNQYVGVTTSQDWDYTTSLRKPNNSVNFGDFADEALFPSTATSTSYLHQAWPGQQGYDHMTGAGADWGDIVFLATHGNPEYRGITSDSGGQQPWGGTYPSCNTANPQYAYKSGTRFLMGGASSSTSQYCRFRTQGMGLSGGYGTSTDDNKRANVFITTACDSADPCIWSDGGYDNVARGSKFIMYNGYYGHHSSGGTNSADQNRFKEYLTASKTSGLGKNWLNYMYRTVDGAEKNCPVSIVYGDAYYKIVSMFENGGARNFQDTGNSSHSVMFWVGGCDPDGSGGHPALPDYTYDRAWR